jgi:outer membrane protein assembly factor BamB
MRKSFPTLCVLLAASAPAAEWPTYNAGAARSGFTVDDLAAELSPAWVFIASHAPEPAWPSDPRLGFDRAYVPVVARGRVFFGSSADGKLYALDAASGALLWTFSTSGPIRVAPVAWENRVLVPSDDGWLYALDAASGALLWKHRGGPGDRKVLGNEHVVSAWPVRGGPVVADGAVYFGAGIWPSEGFHLWALDAVSGKVRWSNDRTGSLLMPQPHGGAEAESGVASQGHLAVAGDLLLVPTGRAVPAAFSRSDGEMRHFHLQLYGQAGGSEVLSFGEHVWCGGKLFDSVTGKLVENLPGRVAAVSSDIVRPDGGVVQLHGGRLRVHAWRMKTRVDRRGEAIRYRGIEPLGSVDGVPSGGPLFTTQRFAVTAGKDAIALVDLAERRVAWSHRGLRGEPLALAAADGRLFASTTSGEIHCFAGTEDAPTEGPARITITAIAATEPVGATFDAAAEEIVRLSSISEGFCVDLGCGDGSLAIALARRTQLQVHAVDGDAERVEAARRRIDAAGLLGARVWVHHADPARTGFPKYFADLVVSGRSVAEGRSALTEAEARRLQRPWGGIVCAGRPGEMLYDVRGALEGAGSWTHQYADAANTCSSADALVKGPLSVLWYRDADLPMPQRHGRAPAPLFAEGRLYVEGLRALRCTSAYNGRTLWEHALRKPLAAFDQDHLMGSAGTGSNLCLGGGAVWVHHGSGCLRLDAASGRELREYAAPPGPDGKPGTWGYLAWDDGVVFGSLADVGHIVRWRYLKGDMSEQFTESKALFAIDAASGETLWTRPALHSIRHNAIAVGGGRVYAIDRPIAAADRVDAAEPAKAATHADGVLLALEARTGKVVWRAEQEVWGTALAFAAEHQALLMSYQPTRFRLPSEVGGRLAVFHTSNGYRLWEKKADYASRPLLNGATVYAQGGAWDLLSGEERPFPFQRSYGCGILAGSQHLFVYRSATLGYWDLRDNARTQSFGGLRLGCWINAVPAGGVVLVPEAAGGCECSYLNRATVVLGEGG